MLVLFLLLSPDPASCLQQPHASLSVPADSSFLITEQSDRSKDLMECMETQGLAELLYVITALMRDKQTEERSTEWLKVGFCEITDALTHCSVWEMQVCWGQISNKRRGVKKEMCWFPVRQPNRWLFTNTGLIGAEFSRFSCEQIWESDWQKCQVTHKNFKANRRAFNTMSTNYHKHSFRTAPRVVPYIFP